jgi:hypothetical protein
MTNRGIAPLEPATDVGKLRLLVGDTEYVELAPAEPGYGDYNNFSDAELEGFIVAGGGSITRASGFAYLRLAALAAAGAISWRSDDLAVDTKLVASEYRLLSRIAFEQADNEDDLLASGFALDFPFSCGDCGSCGKCLQELAAPPVKWCRCSGASCSGWC